MTEAIIGIIGAVTAFAVAAFKFWIDNKKLKIQMLNLEKEHKQQCINLDIFDRVVNLTSVNKMAQAMDRIFANTVADRFLILIAVNGKDDFNKVSVVLSRNLKG